MDLFDSLGRADEDAFVGRLRAFTAPIARDRGAVVDDVDLLDVAEAVYAAFGDESTADGLTRGAISAACRGVCDEATFESRFEVFVGTGMLMPHFEKAHQQRYLFNMTAGAGLLVWQRLSERGGVNELLTLLDSTQAAITLGSATRHDVSAKLQTGRRWLSIAATHLSHLVSSAPLGQLIAERRHHNQEHLVEKVEQLSRLVADQFQDLDQLAYRVLQAAQQYVNARRSFLERVLDEGGRSRDFSLLDPEEYLEAPFTRSPLELAEAFALVVVDPPHPWVDPHTIVATLTAHRPPSTRRERPPQAPHVATDDDPIATRREADNRLREARDRRVELMTGGAAETTAVDALRALGWPEAGRRVADLLAAHADPNSPYTVELSEELIVDPGGPVSHLTPITVLRSPSPIVIAAGLEALFGRTPIDFRKVDDDRQP